MLNLARRVPISNNLLPVKILTDPIAHSSRARYDQNSDNSVTRSNYPTRSGWGMHSPME